MFTKAVNGSFPRFPDPPRPLMLAQAIDEFRQGLIDDRKMLRAFERATVETVVEMVAAGIEIISDGLVRYESGEKGWIKCICSRMKGFDISERGNDPLFDLSDHRPIAIDRIKWFRPVILDDYKFLADRSPVDVRMVLPGPLTMALMCDPGIYADDLEKFTQDIAWSLNREIEGLEQAGSKYILIEEPALAEHKEYKELFKDLSEIICHNITMKIMINVSNGDISGIEELLVCSPFSGIGFDITGDLDNALLIERKGFWKDKIIQLGMISSDPSHIETPMEIAVELVKYSSFHDPGKIWVAPACGMDKLTRSVVFEKLTNLCQGAEWARREMARREEPGGRL